jgi:hypothetical protein
MEHDAILPGAASVPHELPVMVRFLAKFVLDILPAALASVIGGFLFTQYQFGHAGAPHPAAEQVMPASPEMLKFVRDEHAMMVDYLKAQAAAERSRVAAAQHDDERAAAEAAATKAAAAEAAATKAAAAEPNRRLADVVMASLAEAPRDKAAVTVATAAPAQAPAPSLPPPLVIGQTNSLAPPLAAPAPAQGGPAPLVIAQNDSAAPPVPPVPLLPPPPVAPPGYGASGVLARSLDLKDHVVHATLHAVSAIGSIPSWIASIGGHGASVAAGPDTNS